MTPRLSGHRRRSRVDSRALTFAIVTMFGICGALACNRRTSDHPVTGSTPERLQPITTATAGPVRRMVYVPIYASLYLGRDMTPTSLPLTSTLSVRNVSVRYPITIESIRYYDSHGRLVKDHLTKSAELPVLASVEFVAEADAGGGPGANFLVKWSGPFGVDEPLIEAVMVGRFATAGISFTSAGRVVTNEPQ